MGRLKIWVKRFFQIVCGLLLFYGLAIVVGLYPVNSGFTETSDGIEIFVRSGAFHSDLIIPIDVSKHESVESIDWSTIFDDQDFGDDIELKTHLAFGWGDTGFYINTPTWGDMKASTAANALFIPSDTVMHVAYQHRPLENGENRSVKISPEQYSRLVEFILDSFKKDESGAVQPIAGAAYSINDAFYVAQGSYHCFRTCNCWVGEGLEVAGVKVGWFTPLPKSVFLYLPERN